MALIDGLKGGQGYYPAAPILQYEAMQRPQPVALPAGGGRQSAKTPAKREFITGLPGDVLRFEQMRLDAENIRLRLENGEDVSDEEMARFGSFYMTESANRSQIQMNYDYYKNRTENDNFSEYSNEVFLNEENQPVLGEDGKYLRVGSRMENLARSGGGISQNGLIQPIDLSQEKTSSKDYYSFMDNTFKDARSQSQDRYEAQLYVTSNLGFTDKDKEVLVNASNVISENNIALSHAEGVILSRVMNGDRKAYRGAKQAFIQNLENGGSLIPAGFFSKEKQEARKDDIVTINGKDYIKPTEDDFGEFLVYDVKQNSAIHYKKELDPSLFTSIVSDGKGNPNDVGFPTLHLKLTNSKELYGAGKNAIIDMGGVLEGKKINMKQPIFNQNPALVPLFQAAHQKVEAEVDANINDVYASWARLNNMDPSKMNDAEKEIARNSEIAKRTEQELIKTPEFQKTIKDAREAAFSKPQPALTNYQKFPPTSPIGYLIVGAMVLKASDGSIGGKRDIGNVDTMPGALSDMTVNDYYNVAGEVRVYDTSSNDFENTELENGIMALNSTDRFQVLGSVVYPSALDTGGRPVLFINPSETISGFRMDGDVVGGIRGAIVLPKERSILKQIILPFKDEGGEDISLNDYKLSQLGIKETTVTKELLEQLNTYGAGYNVGDKILLIPSTLDATNVHSQSLGHASSDKSTERVRRMQREAQSYSENSMDVISIGK